MKICGGVKTVFLRCVVRALNSRRISNREIAIGAGVGIEAIVRLVSYGLLPSPAECEKLERFADRQPGSAAAEAGLAHRGADQDQAGARTLIPFAGKNRSEYRATEWLSP